MLRSRADIMHAHGLYQLTSYQARVAGCLKNVPVVLTVHGIANYKRPMRFLQAAYEKLMVADLPRVDLFIALTSADRFFLRSLGVSHDRIAVIPNAIDTQYWTPRIDEAGYLHEPSEEILYVGSLVKRKRCDLLIEAFAGYAPEYPTARLSIIGDGPELPLLKLVVHEKGLDSKVSFLGRVSVDDLRSRYRNAGAVVLASEAEGLPTVLLEAMATGAPVVSSDLPGIADLVFHGRNGFVFSEGDSASLIESLLAVRSMSPDKLNRLRAAAIDTVREEFSWDSVAYRVADTYHHVLAGFRVRP